MIDADETLIAEHASDYRDTHMREHSISAEGGTTAYGDQDVDHLPSGFGERAEWHVWDDCGIATKWQYLPGSMSDLAAMNESQRVPIVDFSAGSATGVLIAPTLVLTAGHAAAGAQVNIHQICRKSANGAQNCQVITDKLWRGTDGSTDWGLLLLSGAFPAPTYTYDLCVENDNAIINDGTPRLAGYPVLRMGQESTCTTSALLAGERNLGDFQALLQQLVRMDITSGSGTSGGPYYHFGPNATYEIFGVHSGRDEILGNKFGDGPKVPYWYDDILADANALGVQL